MYQTRSKPNGMALNQIRPFLRGPEMDLKIPEKYVVKEEEVVLDANNLAKMNSTSERVLILDQDKRIHSYALPENTAEGWKILSSLLVRKPWITTDHMSAVMCLSLDETRSRYLEELRCK